MDRPNAYQVSDDSFPKSRIRPYAPDGGLHAEGLALTAAAGAATGIAAGLVFAIVGMWFYAIIIFPIAIGLAIGTVQSFVIKKTKVRNTLACGAIGLLAGLLAVVTMHYVDYETFKYDLARADAEMEDFRQEVSQGLSTQAEFDQAMREYKQDPEIQAMRAVQSFPQYIDWSAHQGVELTSSKSSKPVNLGYAGTYAYWALDALLIAVMVVVMTRSQAAEPFCAECDRWKDAIEMGRLPLQAKQVATAIGGGSFTTLASLTPKPSHLTAVKAYVCGNCQKTDEVVVEVDEVTYPKGKETLSSVGRYVCDESVIDELSKFFDAPATAVPAAEAHSNRSPRHRILTAFDSAIAVSLRLRHRQQKAWLQRLER